MADGRVISATGTVLGEASIEEFRLRGEMLRPGDDGYDAARTVWNAIAVL